jgi:hypothetical protein
LIQFFNSFEIAQNTYQTIPSFSFDQAQIGVYVSPGQEGLVL